MPDLDEAHVSPLADSVRVSCLTGPTQGVGGCSRCASVIAELDACDVAIADEDTEPEARLALSQIVGRLRRLLEAHGGDEHGDAVPVPGQRWRSSTFEAVVDVVSASEVCLARTMRGVLVGRDYVVRESFGWSMRRRGWELVTDAPGQTPDVADELQLQPGSGLLLGTTLTRLYEMANAGDELAVAALEDFARFGRFVRVAIIEDSLGGFRLGAVGVVVCDDNATSKSIEDASQHVTDELGTSTGKEA